MSIVISLLHLLAAYWVYTDARSHGHTTGTALLWAIGVMMALIIVLPIYLFWGRRAQSGRRDPAVDDAIDVEAVPVEETVVCSMCGKRVKDDFKHCPHCGHSLKYCCANCGCELQRDWKVCPQCQTPAPTK